MTKAVATLNTIAAIGLLIAGMATGNGYWLALAAANAVAATWGWVVHHKGRAAAPTLWPDGGQLELWSYHQLVTKHDEGQRMVNEGSPATLGDAALLAIEEELCRRGVKVCACGAPLPDGIHLTHCQEIS